MSYKWNTFEDYVKGLMLEEHIAGAAVAISKNGKIIYQQGFGQRDVEKGLPVTPNTIMGIASVSKSFTALQIMRLAAKGILSVDDLVIKHLPELKLPNMEMNKVKIHHLLSHTTGLPPIERHQDHKSFDCHIEYLNYYKTEPLGEPSQYFSYANDTFLLLGAIIEKYSGKLYNRAMTQLLDELEMNRSTYYIEELDKFNDVTENYTYSKALAEWQSCNWPQLGVFEVGGGVRSCVTDLLNYGELYVNNGFFKGKEIIPKEYLQKMWQPVYEVSKGQYYGYALKSTPAYAGVTVVEHGGSQPGVASNFGFVPEEKLVVAVLSNVSGAPANSIFTAAVNTVLGLDIDFKPLKQTKTNLTNEQVDKLTGYYASDEGGNILIYRDGKNIKAVSNNEHFTLYALSETMLAINEKKIKNTIKFYLKEGKDKAWAVFLGSRVLCRVKE
ncbi:serine hydrolase [Clostridium sp. 'deep sea']|uniref:serine hydrolase domain-containing protein n=1 Tax=Clostridium sp. 'deep sea' TaxID=2779445 RepID=UPI0018967CC8|nr:serine hydrolase domain-containing protein [Clostridium sp. 'deep sea']QOR34361.1 serine hydrolase [Clostridium sp. 'deep sea']